MIIPLANAIFDEKFKIDEFYKSNDKKKMILILKIYRSKKLIENFPIIEFKNRVNEYPSTSIIINATNEIFVDQFLQKKIPFLSISKIIMTILNDKNYKKYAIKKPKNINQINAIDLWARINTLKNLYKQ